MVPGLVGRHPGPRGQLVTAQPERQHAVGAEGGPDGAQHVGGQPEPIRPVGVGPQIGQPRVELAQERAVAGIDLHAVEPRRHGPPAGGGEAGDQLVDVRLAPSPPASRG